MGSFERFIRVLLAWNPQGPALHMSIKYWGDDQVYMAWPPPLGCCLTDDRLPDPGFGSGPVRLDEIEFIVVHDHPAADRQVHGYSENFAAFVEHTRPLEATHFVERGVKVENAG